MIRQHWSYKYVLLVVVSTLLVSVAGLTACAKPVPVPATPPTPAPNSGIESHVDILLIDVGDLKDKVDWIEVRQKELRQKVSDLDYILSDFDKIEERIEGVTKIKE